MRENNILKSLLKYICITISALFTFVIPAKADFDLSTFINGIPTTGTWGDATYSRWDTAGVAYVGTAYTAYTDDSIILSAEEWRLKKNDYGTIYGIGRKTDTNNGTSLYETGDPGVSSANGEYCWCKITGVAGTDGVYHEVEGGSWLLTQNYIDASGCDGGCAISFQYNDSENYRAKML